MELGHFLNKIVFKLELAECCSEFGKSSLSLLEKMREKSPIDEAEVDELTNLMKRITAKLNELLPKVHDINKDEIGDLIDKEMQKTSEAIEAAVAKLEVNKNEHKWYFKIKKLN